MRDQLAVASDQVLVEIPRRVGAGSGRKLIEEGVRVTFLDRYLFKHRKLDAVGLAAEVLDFFLGAGLLTHKVI